MEAATILEMLNDLSTACLADGCLRLDITVSFAPCAIRLLMPGTTIYGPVRPARHFGGIDVFLETLEKASAGEVLVVDNEGRLGEARIDDLISLEVKMAGLNGIVIWGLHRDTAELAEIALRIFSPGCPPARPRRASPADSDSLTWARIGAWDVGTNDFLIGDDDSVPLLPIERLQEIIASACTIHNSERTQSQEMSKGLSLRTRMHFSHFLSDHAQNPKLTFQQHVPSIDAQAKL